MPNTLPQTGQAEIPLDVILVSGDNPRTHFDEEAMQELVRSIEKDGLLQSILVRPIPSDEEYPYLKKAKEEGRLPAGWEDWPERDGPLYELVSGERRLRAHQELSEETIRAEIKPMSRATAVRLRLIENVQREDLDELEEARAYQRMIDELEYDVEGIAEEVGKSTSYVYQRLKLLELAEPVREALSGGDLTAGHAIEIARLPTPELQERALGATLVSVYGRGESTISVRDLRDWIRRNTHLDLHKAPWKKDDAKLLPQAGSCTACPKRTGNAADLWPEVETGATCTDPDCYERKLVAYVDRRASELEEEGTDFVRVTTELWTVHTGASLKRQKESGRVGAAVTSEAIGKRSYTRLEAAEECDHAIVGLVVDGGEPGELIDVCTASDCEVHSDGRSGVDPKEEERRKVWQRNSRERGRRESKVDRRLAEALLEADLGLGDRAHIALIRLWDELWVDNQKAAAEALGLDGHSTEDIRQWAEGRSGSELLDALFTMCLAEYLGGSTSARPPEAYRIRGDALQDLNPLSIDDVEAEVREESNWTLPEDLVDLAYLVPPSDDDGMDRQTYHLGEAPGAAAEEFTPFCGGGPAEASVQDAEPTGWRWELCTTCRNRIIALQTSAMEEEDDG
jgi:ParB/RepB/Spo0J family partition protein